MDFPDNPCDFMDFPDNLSNFLVISRKIACFRADMQKVQENLQANGSESRAAMQQILKTSCLLDEIQQKPHNSCPTPSDFLQNLLSATNLLGNLAKLQASPSVFPQNFAVLRENLPNFNENPLKLLSFLAENQKEVSSSLYNAAMGRKIASFPRESAQNHANASKKPTPFGRAGIHVAIAYYIYVNQSKVQDFTLVDPTKAARSLRERKFVSFIDILCDFYEILWDFMRFMGVYVEFYGIYAEIY